MSHIRVVAVLLAVSSWIAPELHAQRASSGSELTGVWKARRSFGPDARGPVLIMRTGTVYTADMMGFTIPVQVNEGELSFELPNGAGGFRGKPRTGGTIRGFWFPGAAGSLGAATPVTLHPKAPNRWVGQVVPVADELTWHLRVSRQPDGSLVALLRNPERDWGAVLGIRSLVRNADSVSLIALRSAPGRDTTAITGLFDSARQSITLNFRNRGGSYEFRRLADDQSGFYARGKGARYVYRAPPALDDGWAIASVDDVGIDRAAVERVVQELIDLSMDSINAPQIHSLLIVRRGKLVLEEYFHGEHRAKVHNTRSGSKSVTVTIAGAAMLSGTPIRLSAPVYPIMNGGVFPPDLEPRKRSMTLEHLLSMSSGYFCDDNNPNAPGREDGMWDQTSEPDFYRFTLKLPMAAAPGEQAVYCSVNPNLALGLVGRAAGESPYHLFDRLVAAPLGIDYYAWAMDRARNPYGGGGMSFFSRDFIKFGQLMLNGGAWRGRRIISREFIARATSPLYRIGARDYGLGWWREEYPYENRTVRAFAALGAGGQMVMVFPELDLVVATTGGSYISRGWRYAGGQLIPNILTTVRRL